MTHRYLGLRIKTADEWLSILQDCKASSMPIDFYNAGEAVAELESKTAKILNKPAALFFPKGMAAQFAMLKCSEERKQNSNIIVHPLSHIAWDEKLAYQKLLNLNAIMAGPNDGQFTAEDLDQIEVNVATCVVEMPLRRAGFRLLEWAELEKISHWAKNNNVHLHMDGARLWEASKFYTKSEAEIAALFDTVYVSFYKGLGGMGGSVLAGEEDFIEQCRDWRTRLCNDYFTVFPLVISALKGLEENRPKLDELHQRAKEIAHVLSEIDGLEIMQPQTNAFFVFIEGELEAVNAAVQRLDEKYGIKLFFAADKYPNTERVMIELQVGHEHQLISNDEIKQYFSELIKETV